MTGKKTIDFMVKPTADLTRLIEEIQPEINKKLNKVDTIQTEISILENKINEIESYKKLIYSNGKELENVFMDWLKKLGGDVVPAKYSEEEYCLVYKQTEYPVEVKGVSKSITLTHLRQIIDYMLKHEEATEEKCKGILSGNPWKNRPIKERNSKGNPNFPPNVIERAKEMNVILISSVAFFHAFCKFIEDKSLGETILNQITDSTGLVKFKV